MDEQLKRLIENLIVLDNSNAVEPILDNFIKDVSAKNCNGTIEVLNDYIEEEIQEWAYNQ